MIFNRIKNLLQPQPVIEASPELTQELKQDYNNHRPLGPQPCACYAPLKNMYFGHHGNVFACCYNRSQLLGKYPQQTIKEIWLSGSANQLRAHLKAYNFSKGCQACLGQLVAGNFDGAKARGFDEQKLNANKFPSIMEFELDNTCNLECIMCSGDFSSLIRTKREKRAELPKPYDDEFLRQLAGFIPHLQEARFYGGEPFLISTYYQIWNKIIELNSSMHISVQTNGTVLNTRVKEILSKTKFSISISLDSLDKMRYEEIRLNSSFDTVMSNLNYFHNYCSEQHTYFGISACIMQQNWFEAPAFVRFCNALNAPVYFHTVTYPDFTALRQLSKERLHEIYGQLLAQYDRLPEDTTISKKNKKHYHDFILQISEWSRTRYVNPETSQINSVEQLLAFFIQKTHERNDMDPQRKEITIKKITENMRLLAQLVHPGESIQDFIKHVNPQDNTSMLEAIEYAANGSITEAVYQTRLQSGAWLKNRK